MSQVHMLLKKIIPELIELYEKRYTILRNIYSMQPIGRRSLAISMNLGERIVRSETAFLKEAGFIEIHASGMTVTAEGENLLEGLRDFYHELRGLHELESQLAEILKLKKVVIVPGDVDTDESVLMELGKAAAGCLKALVSSSSVIAVTGGSTVRAVANALQRTNESTNVVVIPARGGMGSEVEHQSNTVASMIAKKLGGEYRLLHVPDQLGVQAAETLLNEPDIRSVIEWLKNADILLYGIGRAQEMAERRNLPEEQRRAIQKAGAIAEAFGYYFNEDGEVVLASNAILLNDLDLKRISSPIGVAGGKQKAQAIMAVAGIMRSSMLVTDEGAAREIIRLHRIKQSE